MGALAVKSFLGQRNARVFFFDRHVGVLIEDKQFNMSLNLGDYNSDEDDSAPAPQILAQNPPPPPEGTSFFNADDVELSESEPEENDDASSDEDLPAKRACALPPVNELFATKPPRPEFLHRAAIYEVRELSTFDKRIAMERPKPWLKAGPAPVGAPIVRDHSLTRAAAAENNDEEEAQQPRRLIAAGFAEQITAAAMCLSKSYAAPAASAGGAGDDEDAPRTLVPICEINNQKRAKGAKNVGGPKSFREKEKRKRDMGMQARDKSYVEEEKRVLRESMAPSFGQGFD
jgi:hypothetical protein